MELMMGYYSLHKYLDKDCVPSSPMLVPGDGNQAMLCDYVYWGLEQNVLTEVLCFVWAGVKDGFQSAV